MTTPAKAGTSPTKRVEAKAGAAGDMDSRLDEPIPGSPHLDQAHGPDPAAAPAISSLGQAAHRAAGLQIRYMF